MSLCAQILPAVVRFKPDLILVSAGFDAHRKDEINYAYIGVTEKDYEWLTDQIVQVANRCALMPDLCIRASRRLMHVAQQHGSIAVHESESVHIVGYGDLQRCRSWPIPLGLLCGGVAADGWSRPSRVDTASRAASCQHSRGASQRTCGRSRRATISSGIPPMRRCASFPM